MKILAKELKHGSIKVQVDTLDDLWYLSALIEEKDRVEGVTERKIKLDAGSDRDQKVIRKTVFLEIGVEKVEFHKYANILRVSGKIINGPEDVPRGTYHTFNVEEGSTFRIKKEQWLTYQLKKLKKQQKQSRQK